MAVSTTATRREQLINIILNELDDDQLEMASNYIKLLQLEAAHLANYDPDNDPSVGFFSAEPQLASRTKEILDAEFGTRKSDTGSAWFSDDAPQVHPPF